MNDLERIKHIKKTLGITLKLVPAAKLSTEHSFFTTANIFLYSLADRLDPKFFFKGVRNYSLDENGNVTGLALDFCGLFLLEDNYLGNFAKLKKLKLKNSYLNDYSFLTKLENLRELDLTANRLSNYDFLKELRGLTSLNLRNNNLSNGDFLKELRGLTSLDLSSNKLSNYDFLKELRGLTSLDLRNNNLSNYDFLKELRGLTSLDLSFNNLSNGDFLKELRGLTSLDLRNNNLSNYDFLKELKGLTSLDLSYNNLSNGDFLSGLMNLMSLRLYGNPNLDLADNLKKMIEDKGEYSFLDRDEINQIIRFYEQLEEAGFDYIYEAKMLIVGEPGAGKTTLFEKMKDSDYMPIPNNPLNSTVGVQIKVLEFPYTKDENITFKAHLWDFGGQSIQYVLHQYFFTERSLYVLLADDRKQLTNFNYWFEIIATLGQGCPVLVVLNEINHQSVTNFDLSEYRKEFGAKVKSLEKRDVDFLNNDLRFFQLKELIQDKLCSLKHIGEKVPKTWIPLREQLAKEAENAPYIYIDKYNEFCEIAGVKEKYRRDVLRYFHDLGIALNYENDDNLDDIVILDPHWIIDALYVVLKNTKVKENCGIFTKEFVCNLWANAGYSKISDHKFLLRLMQKGQFEVAYKKENKNEYVAPILLPDETPKYEFDETNAIQIYFQYTFMPPGIFSRLVVRLNEIIAKQNGKQIVWKKGVLFERENAVAEVIESEHQKRITIKVSGKDFIKNKELLTIIRNEVTKIHKDWFENRLNFDELVPCICEVCQKTDGKTFYKLKKLEERLRNNKSTIECENKPYNDVNVRRLLEGVFIEDKSIKRNEDFMNDKPTFHIAGNVGQIITDPKDNVSITQNNNSADYENISRNLDAISAKLDANQSQIMEQFADFSMAQVQKEITKLSPEEQKEFEEVKKGKWETKLKFVFPLIPKIPFLGEFFPSASLETTRTITADEYVGWVQKTYGEKLQTGILSEVNSRKLNP